MVGWRIAESWCCAEDRDRRTRVNNAEALSGRRLRNHNQSACGSSTSSPSSPSRRPQTAPLTSLYHVLLPPRPVSSTIPSLLPSTPPLLFSLCSRSSSSPKHRQDGARGYDDHVSPPSPPNSYRSAGLTACTVWTTVKAAEMVTIRQYSRFHSLQNFSDISQLDTMASTDRRCQRHPFCQDARTSSVGRRPHEHGW